MRIPEGSVMPGVSLGLAGTGKPGSGFTEVLSLLVGGEQAPADAGAASEPAPRGEEQTDVDNALILFNPLPAMTAPRHTLVPVPLSVASADAQNPVEPLAEDPDVAGGQDPLPTVMIQMPAKDVGVGVLAEAPEIEVLAPLGPIADPSPATATELSLPVGAMVAVEKPAGTVSTESTVDERRAAATILAPQPAPRSDHTAHAPRPSSVNPVLPAAHGAIPLSLPTPEAPAAKLRTAEPLDEPTGPVTAPDQIEPLKVNTLESRPVTKPAELLEPPRLAQQVRTQLLAPLARMVSEDGNKVIKVRLHPEELGPVTVKATFHSTGVRIELQPVTETAREAVRNALPELRRDLAAHGSNANLDLSDNDSNRRNPEHREPHQPPAATIPHYAAPPSGQSTPRLVERTTHGSTDQLDLTV